LFRFPSNKMEGYKILFVKIYGSSWKSSRLLNGGGCFYIDAIYIKGPLGTALVLNETL
jgi:hypothetical protein